MKISDPDFEGGERMSTLSLDDVQLKLLQGWLLVKDAEIWF